MKIVKIGSVEFTMEEVERLYKEGKYIVTYSKVYAIHYSQAQDRYYGSVVYNHPTRGGVGLARRGRFFSVSAEQVNKLIGCNFLK